MILKYLKLLLPVGTLLCQFPRRSMPTVLLDADSHTMAGVLLHTIGQLTLGVVDVEGSSPPPQVLDDRVCIYIYIYMFSLHQTN